MNHLRNCAAAESRKPRAVNGKETLLSAYCSPLTAFALLHKGFLLTSALPAGRSAVFKVQDKKMCHREPRMGVAIQVSRLLGIMQLIQPDCFVTFAPRNDERGEKS